MNQDIVSRLILALDTPKHHVSRSQPEKTSNLSSLDNDNENTHLITRQSIPTSGQPSAPDTRHVISCGLPDIPVEELGSPFQYAGDCGNSAFSSESVPLPQPTCSTDSSSGSNAYCADDADTTSKQDDLQPVSEFAALAPDGALTILPAHSIDFRGRPCWPVWAPVRQYHAYLPYMHPSDGAFYPLHPLPPPPPPPPYATPWRYHPYARHFRPLSHGGPTAPATWRRFMGGGQSVSHLPSGVCRHPPRVPRHHYMTPPLPHAAVSMLPFAPRAAGWVLGCHPWGFEAPGAVRHEDGFEGQQVAPGDHVYGGYGGWDAVATGLGDGGEGGFGFSAGGSVTSGVAASERRVSSAVALAELGPVRECTIDGDVPDVSGQNELIPHSGAGPDQLRGEGYEGGKTLAEGSEGGVGVLQNAREVKSNDEAVTGTAPVPLGTDTSPKVAATEPGTAATVNEVAAESQLSPLEAHAVTLMLRSNSKPLSTTLFVQRPPCFPVQPHVLGSPHAFTGSIKRTAPPQPPHAPSEAVAGTREEEGTAGTRATSAWGCEEGGPPPPLRRRRSHSLLPKPSSAVPPMPRLSAPGAPTALAAEAAAVQEPTARQSAQELSPLSLPLPPPPLPLLNANAAPLATAAPAVTAAAPQRQHVLPFRLLPYRQHPYHYYGSAHASSPVAAAVNYPGPAAVPVVPEPDTDPDGATSVDQGSVPLGLTGFGATNEGLPAADGKYLNPWPPGQALLYGPVRSSVPPSIGWGWHPAPPYAYAPFWRAPAVAGPLSAAPVTFTSEHRFVPRIRPQAWPCAGLPQA